MGQAAKQVGEIALEPAIESPKVTPFEGKENADSDHITGIEVRVGMFDLIFHLFIDMVENMDDNVFRGHGTVLLASV
jgi:hypothetical protein